MKMICSALLMLLVSNFALADGIVLGEYQGLLTGQNHTKVEDGAEVNYPLNCETAMNISWNADSFSTNFSYYNCGGNMVFNGEVFSLVIRGRDAYLRLADGTVQDKPIGRIQEGGTLMVEFTRQQTAKWTEYMGCNNEYIVRREMELPTHITLQFKKVAPRSYMVSRGVSTTSLQMAQKPDPRCVTTNKKYSTYVSVTTNGVVDGTLSGK